MLRPFQVHKNRQLPSEISEPLLEWNAENGVAVPMDMQFEYYENLAEQSQEVLDALLETPRPCKLLNPNLHSWKLGLLNQTCYVVNIEHEGAPRLALMFGCYKQHRDAVVESSEKTAWNALSEDDAPMELPLARLGVQQPRYYQVLQPQLTTRQL